MHGQRASNINYSTLVLNFDVCRASSTNYDQKEKKNHLRVKLYLSWLVQSL